MPESTRKRPDLEVRAGTISVAVWNEPPARDGRAGPQFTIRVEKRYRDEKTGQWRSTSFYRVDELGKLVIAASKAYELLTLRVVGRCPDTVRPESVHGGLGLAESGETSDRQGLGR